MPRKLFCELSPLTYKLSVIKCILIRAIKNLFYGERIGAISRKSSVRDLFT